MICKQCNNEIDGGSLVCPICLYTAPLNEERKKLTDLKDRQASLLRSLCHSPLFLAFTVCLSIVALATVGSVVQGNVTDLLAAIFMAVSAVGLWRSYFAKDNRSLADALSTSALYDGFLSVIYVILAICDILATLGGATLAFLVFDGVILESISSRIDELREIALLLMVVGLIFGFIMAAMLFVVRSVFARRRRFIVNLSRFAAEGSYTPCRTATVGSYIIGAINIAGGVILLLMTLASSGITSLVSIVLGLASSLGGDSMAELAGYAQAFSTIVIGTISLGGISRLALGLYYIISARFMKSVDTEAMALRSDIEHQNVLRLDLERRTKAEIERIQKSRTSPADTEKAAEPAEKVAEEAPVEAVNETVEEAPVKAVNETAEETAPTCEENETDEQPAPDEEGADTSCEKPETEE